MNAAPRRSGTVGPGESAPAARQASRHDPADASALRQLAAAEVAGGNAEKAVATARRAVKAAPRDPDTHFLLALALRMAGREEAACSAYRAALGCDPRHVKSLNNLGNLLAARGRLDEAETLLRRAAEADPYGPQAPNNLGLLLDRQGRTDEAERCFRAALALRSDYAQAHYNLGCLLGRQERYIQAADAFQAALASRPGFADAHDELGRCLLRLRRPAEALDHSLAAWEQLGDSATLPHDIGVALTELDRYDEAETWLRRAVERQPAAAESWVGLANLAVRRRDPKAALRLYDQAIAVAPEHGNAHFQRALVLLSQGEYARGWAEYEWRWRSMQPMARSLRQPAWRGDAPLAGRTILLHAEQGFGDTLQFGRYVPRVAEAGGRVVLEVPREVARLYAGFPGVAEVVVQGETPQDFDLHTPLLSLPLAFGTTIDTIPPPVPFRAYPRAAGQRGPARVGVAWAGNRVHADDHRRSIPLRTFACLFATPGVEFIVLQKELRPGDEALLAAIPAVSDGVAAASDFADTAAVVAGLDLVISVDSSVAHLAATIGVPTWVLLPHTCDWRWDTGRADTPWYPSARLFRQPRVGAWDSVLADVAASLAARAVA